MYIEDGIAYAGDPKPLLNVCGVRPLKGYKLWVRFNTGEAKLVDFSPWLDAPAFQPLKEETVFASVYIDRGVTVWQDGEIDIAPEALYENGVLVDNTEIA